MTKIKVDAKDLKKAINAKQKVKKAGKAISSALKAVFDFGKDVDSIAIGFKENKNIKEIAFEREEKEFTIRLVLK